MYKVLFHIKEKYEAEIEILNAISSKNKIEKNFDIIRNRYIEFHEHPNLDYRIEAIKNYKEWNLIEYYKHAFVVLNWIKSGKGWTGE